jgi:aminocarboxymuconate-semialdehyde decarboxylase
MANRREFLTNLATMAAGIIFVGCDLENALSCAPLLGQSIKRRQVTVGGHRALTIDIHSHCYVDIADLIKGHEPVGADGKSSNPFLAPILSPTGVETRIQQMDESGVDMQAVSLVPSYNYWADRDLASAIVSRQNERIAAMCAAHPDRFVSLGTVALQHPDLAVEQMSTAIKDFGMRGFEIACSVNGDELSDPKFNPFWAKAEELDVLVFIHPVGVMGNERQLQGNGYLNNVIGHPLETTVALSHLIFEGTLDRFPKIKICAAHGGGFLASYLGRTDHCAEFSERCKPVQKRPSDYFKQQLYCDSIVFTPEGLRHLVAEVGADHVLLGTDFPFDISTPHMGDARAVDTVLAIPGLAATEYEKILGRNAAKLLKVTT